MERREFVAAAASVIFIPSRRPSAYHDPTYVQALTGSLAGSRYELGGIPLTHRALGHLRQLERSTSGTRDQALLKAGADLADQAALVLYDAGRLSEANRASVASLGMAHRSKDKPGQARAYETLSRISLYREDPARSIAYAEQGLSVGEISHAQRAALMMRLGRSLALVPGQAAKSRSILDQARGTGGLSPFAEAALIGDVGIGFGHLKEFNEANSLLGEAAESIGQWSPLFQAQYLGRQIQAALAAKAVPFAADRMHELARSLPFVSSERVNARAREVLKASAKWRSAPEMSHARDHLRSMLAT